MQSEPSKIKNKHKRKKKVQVFIPIDTPINRRPTLKGIANQVKNIRRVSRPMELGQVNQIEPITNVYTIPSPNESSKPHRYPLLELIKQKVSNFIQRRRRSIRDLEELREMAKRMPHVEKARNCCPLPFLQPTRELDIHQSVKRRHLELESLCCLGSCVIRGGCVAIIVAELLYVISTTLVVALKFNSTKFILWNKLELNFNALIFHPIFLYALLLFNLITTLMICALIFSILRFQRLYAKLHWQYDFFALAFNVIMLILYTIALSSKGPESWDILNIVLIACFFTQIPVQLWAISVVKDCFNFFNLLYVLISIAE